MILDHHEEKWENPEAGRKRRNRSKMKGSNSY
jgi:hypothetical protein